MATQAPVVLITGAAGNLGQAVARAFAASGAVLALTDGDPARLHAAAAELALPAARCRTYTTDLIQHAAALALGERAAAELGRIDVLVNIAGGFRMGPVHETPEATWELMMDLNARTVFNMAQAVVPGMIKRGGGRIINISSRGGLSGAAGIGVYAAAKAAVLRLSESMAAELREHRINVNCVLPSIIDTPQNRQAMPTADFSAWVKADSLAEVILFLASPGARDISGAAIPVYGRS